MRSLRFVFPFLSALPLLAGCSVTESIFGGGEHRDPCSKSSALDTAAEEKEPGGIHGFSSEGDLDAYVAKIEAKSVPQGGGGGVGGSGDCEGALAADSPSAGMGASQNAGTSPSAGASADEGSKSSNEGITNNQEQGVDEGGIVKNIGDSLVILRKGRLYVANVAAGQAPSLSDSMRVARTEALNSSVWYDEMLVKGDLVYVIGYRYGIGATSNDGYARGATEVDTFRVTNGKLARLKSMFLESNDYYSGTNYASRMVGGKLVFYMPHYIGRDANKKLVFPRVLTADDSGTFSAVGPIFGALDVFTSLTVPSYATFHTVVQCDLPESGELSCHGRSVIGSWWRETYVSPDAVYLWASSHVYRFDFDSLDITAHTANGSPLDQFSFRQSSDKLLVAVNPQWSYGGSSQQGTPAKPAILSLPLAAFDKKGEQNASSVDLADKGFLSKNRFVGDVLVAEVGSDPYSYGSTGAQGTELVTFDGANGKIARRASSNVVRIEPLGDRRALVVTGSTNGIALEAYSVDALDQALSKIDLQGAAEGEGRSHGFFYKPDANGNGAGTIGYAVVAPPEYGAGWGWGNGISNLGFFDVSSSGAMSALGIVSAGKTVSECETSCIDWYGNTRPIFLGARSFALMGSELAEVSVRPTVQRIGSAVVLTSNETTLNQQ